MSMAFVLEGTRDYLRSQNTWTYEQIGIQFQTIPPNTARQWYIGMDDAGVESAIEKNYYLTETFSIEIGIWREHASIPRDRSGEMQLATDIYIAGIKTLNALERLVIAQLHGIYAVPAAINAQFTLPSIGSGGVFRLPLAYRGRTRNEKLEVADVQDSALWFGRRLLFRGLPRTQYINSQK